MTLREIIRLAERATKRPWEQLTGKYMAVDCGESPQVFRALTQVDEDYVMAAANHADRLAEDNLRLREALRDLRGEFVTMDDGNNIPAGDVVTWNNTCALADAALARSEREFPE